MHMLYIMSLKQCSYIMIILQMSLQRLRSIVFSWQVATFQNCIYPRHRLFFDKRQCVGTSVYVIEHLKVE